MRFSRSISKPLAILALILLSSSTSNADDRLELTKDDGPYMVLAYSFRGPQAEGQARALAKELRKDHELPAFVLQPTVKRTDESCVLVGNCKSSRESFDLMRKVKKMNPKCLETTRKMKTPGLSRAVTTTNPLAKLD